MLNPGDTAPDFTLPDQSGDPVTLSSFTGQSVVVYFYPKADTPGCTTQACGIRDHEADYAARGAVVLGVSPDAPKKIAKFDEKFSLGFPLLGDEDHAVAEAYGVWVKKSMYGREYMGNERTTFVIGPDGVIADVLRKVKAGPARRARARGARRVARRPGPARPLATTRRVSRSCSSGLPRSPSPTAAGCTAAARCPGGAGTRSPSGSGRQSG